MKLYSVRFVDGRDGYHNHTLLEAESERDIRDYMDTFGHTIVSIEER